MGYLKGRSATLIHEKHANLKYKYENKSFWSIDELAEKTQVTERTIANDLKYIRDYFGEVSHLEQTIDPYRKKLF